MNFSKFLDISPVLTKFMLIKKKKKRETKKFNQRENDIETSGWKSRRKIEWRGGREREFMHEPDTACHKTTQNSLQLYF